MEADWSVEIGPEMPVIDPLWPGLVDLLSSPHRIAEIEDAASFPPLATTLLQINQQSSEDKQENPQQQDPAATSVAFWTVKCDLWQPEDTSWDPDEMDATEAEAKTALACYIDLLPRSLPSSMRLLFRTWRDAEQSAKALALSMRSRQLSCSRADLIVRSVITATQEGFGITAYLTACGAHPHDASTTLAYALEELTSALLNFTWPDSAETPLPLQ